MFSLDVWDVNIHHLILVIWDDIVIMDKTLGVNEIRINIWDVRKHPNTI